MGMDWLNGLIGGSGNMIPPGQPIPGGAPYGGAQPYGAPEQPAWGAAPPGGIMASMPSAPGVAPWAAAPAAADPRVAALETQCNELRRDVESIALFARTLLTLLQEKQIVTPEQFAETHRKLDMLDGKLDDRIAVPR